MVVTEPPRRRRRCGPKVKSGCQTCKIRRVKCDEAKPSCQRCTSTGRKCDGYAQDILIARPQDAQDRAIIHRISTSMPGNREERRGFSYFLHNTTVELSGYFDTSFWQQLLVQASTAEPALRHAVIGIGSLHEAFTNRRLDYSPDSIERGFAINQYTKAIGHLRRSLATGKQEPLTALMSCILFVCFDSIRGHFKSAMLHLQSGLRILRDFKSKLAGDSIANSLGHLLIRLSIQAVLYIDTREASDQKAFAAELMEVNMPETHIPESFESLEEARDGMCQAANALFQMFYMCDGDLPYVYQHEALPLYEKNTSRLAKWNTAFETLMQAKSRSFTSKQIRGAALLKIQHTTATIMADAALPDMNDSRSVAEISNTPDNFLKYTGDFQTIVNLSRSLILASEADAKSGKSALTFSTDLGLIAPLYYVCIKCPDRSIRTAAIELLMRDPRREGMWDSVATEKLIRGFWEIKAKHPALQIGNETTPSIPFKGLDLVFMDGMKWEWKWKQPVTESRADTPGDLCWTDGSFFPAGTNVW